MNVMQVAYLIVGIGMVFCAGMLLMYFTRK
jgi:Mg2+ and Co2+ transporter CorA